MRILTISHACAVDVNQQLFVEMAALPDTELQLVIPKKWRQDYSLRAERPEILEGLAGQVKLLPVVGAGSLHCHFYTSGMTEILDRFRPDVVFIDEEPWSFAVAQIAVLCRSRGIPFVPHTNQNIQKRYPPPFSWIEQRTYRLAAAIVCVSEEVVQVLRRKGFRGKAPILPYACDLSLFHVGNEKELRAQLQLSGMVIGYMGRFVPEKGLLTLVDAVKRLIDEASTREFKVLMVGSGPQEAELRGRIAESGMEDRFVFTGPVPHSHAGDYMRCMDVFVLPSLTTPSWKEQFGRVIVEAMACGVPVVGSDSGHIPRLIEETRGGLVFREGDGRDLALKLGRIIEDEPTRLRLGSQGEAAVRARYTYRAIAQDLREILSDCRVTNKISGPDTKSVGTKDIDW